MKQFNVPIIYKSPLIAAIKTKRKANDKLKKDFTPTILNFKNITIYLARHFGFCYGVENAIEIAFRTIEENKGKNIYLLSEMIHNPNVNNDLLNRGLKFLQDTKGNQLIPFEKLTNEDVVIIPAFGTTIEIENILIAKGIEIKKYNTTCPFVEKVWNRSEQIANKGFSIIVHGKPNHEETRATFSHAGQNAPTLVLEDMKDAIFLSDYILGKKTTFEIVLYFKERFNTSFDFDKSLNQIGVVNQTTMLASDTQAIADFLKNTMIEKFSDENISEHFAETRDTLCYATLDNQTSVENLLSTPADIAFVVGGYKSSNTSHLVELCENKLPTYYIEDANKIKSEKLISHFNWRTNEELISENYLPNTIHPKILITSGASCPDALVEQLIEKILKLYNCDETLDVLIKEFE